jgi:hypothetical protein
MSAVATLRFDSSMQSTFTATTAVRVYDIIGASHEFEARNARDMPKVGHGHPKNVSLFVQAVAFKQEGPNFWMGTATYGSLDTGGGGGEVSDDPLAEPIALLWRIGNTTVPIDRDVEKNPIVNSAGDPFTTPPNIQFQTLFVEARRNERTFNPQIAVNFANAVNQDRFVIDGRTYASKGQAKVVSIAPDSEYQPRKAKFVSVVYIFELRADGFKLRLMDQGTRAWAYKSGEVDEAPYHILDKNDSPVTTDVPLNGRGIPKAGTYRYLATEGVDHIARKIELTPKARPAGPSGAEIESNDNATFLKYQVYKEMSFAGLRL